MKHNNILKTASVLGALALMVGGVVAADAAMGRNNGANKSLDGDFIHERGSMMRGNMNGLSEEEKAEKFEEMEERRESNRAEMEFNREAVEEAINENNFEKWQTAVGENHPFADKINADNFSTFVEIHKSMEEIREKLAELGIEQKGDGLGMGHGMGNGGFMMMNR